MKREILFRGKRTDNGEWIEGNLFIDDCYGGGEKCYIEYMKYGSLPYKESQKVNIETIGQFTGLYDKNYKKIFEGDIVLTQPIKTRPYSKTAKTKRRLGKVVWNSGKHKAGNFITEPTFTIEFIDKENDYHCWSWSLFYECEVIGNINDNPELLGEQNDDNK